MCVSTRQIFGWCRRPYTHSSSIGGATFATTSPFHLLILLQDEKVQPLFWDTPLARSLFLSFSARHFGPHRYTSCTVFCFLRDTPTNYSTVEYTSIPQSVVSTFFFATMAAPGPPGGLPPLPPPPPPPPGGATTFRELYSEASFDPYGGNYADVITTFTVDPTTWDADVTLLNALRVGVHHANAYVGLFSYDGEAAGRTRLLHLPQEFPGTLGVNSPYDGRNYAYLDEVVGGNIQTVVFPSDAFERASNTGLNIYATATGATAAWAADPTLTIIDLIPPGTANTGRAHVPNLMYVPPAYIPLFLGRRLTPRQLITEVVAEVVRRGQGADMAGFLAWCVYAGTAATAGGTASPLHAGRDVTVPVADANFLSWRQRLLNGLLPSLAGIGMAPATAATVRMAGLMGDILREQKDARADKSNARAIASAPKTVGEYFKAYLTDKLMKLCDVTTESSLPELWAALAAAGGKREREVIEESFRTIASALGLPELTPVVTPSFTKKITAMRFAGANLDDLSEGVHPFAVIIMDHTTSSGEQLYNDAMAAAHDYDDLMRGSGTADLGDIKILKSSAKVLIPETYALGRAMLQSYRIVLVALLGETHMLVEHYSRFLTSYTNRENFYMGRLQRVDTSFGVARLLRYVQLSMRAWFEEIWDSPASAGVMLPDFQHPLSKMALGDMQWLPQLPAKYLPASPAPSPASTDKPVPGGPKEEPKKKADQVRNNNMDPRFDEFKLLISKTKFNDVIKKVGEPPKVTRGGKDISMCASYHLRGSCFSNCNRRADHGSHKEEESAALYDWCKLAFA